MTLLDEIKAKALDGIPASVEEALRLNDICTTDELADAANEVRLRWEGDTIDTCSIINARSGHCSEDCKWCAQSRFHATGINEYEFVPEEEALKAAKINCELGIKRLSLVTSGRKVAPADMERFCELYRKISAETGLYLCASMGLLNLSELKMLKAAGVKRYHCNLETSSRYFGTLCTTHSHSDKLKTIKMAQEAGLQVCSGGIIGMGESMRDRLELAQEARDAGAVSIPVNILNPIPGTPLQDTPLISEDEIIRSVTLMRLIAPKVTMRFAGGRMRLSKKTMERILLGGMNGALMGDMLTTVGNSVNDDKELFEKCGYQI
ncbi:biotin synthase BioB [uncultured Muribaculum sp.]|uniref:biotin synthase BioB n=1 Tax=uncultured Muribaculum sp. TaxID=1918613 RepID=UPI0025920209|nr:biotin synthase BioB [uncultured Muribaculum sp.]